MSTDQREIQHPGTQHHQQPSKGEPTQLDHPGLTKDMPTKPDHGEHSYKGFGRLKDKRAIITGGDSGIGRAVAIAFAREGADVCIAYLPQEEEDAKETEKWVTDSGRKIVKVPGDIREEGTCKNIVDRCVKDLGGVDILVNNAAYQMVQDSIQDVTTEQFDRTMKTNLYSMFWLTKFATPHMKPGSTIINTTSIQAFQPKPQLLDYAMTKAAIVNFTKSMAGALMEKGIRVNAVAPGPIWTPLIPATMTEEMVEQFGKNNPLGRAGQPVEMATSYVFFASQESSYITADVMACTGGKSIV